MSSIWRKYHGALIPWKPPHLDIGLSRDEIKQEIKDNNAFLPDGLQILIQKETVSFLVCNK